MSAVHDQWIIESDYWLNYFSRCAHVYEIQHQPKNSKLQRSFHEIITYKIMAVSFTNLDLHRFHCSSKAGKGSCLLSGWSSLWPPEWIQSTSKNKRSRDFCMWKHLDFCLFFSKSDVFHLIIQLLKRLCLAGPFETRLLMPLLPGNSLVSLLRWGML